MATSTTQTLAVTCPKCGARFRLAAEMAGKKGRCAKCGDVFRVPAAAAPVPSPAKPLPTKGAPAPKPIAVYCRVCQTLMYGRADQIGHQLKCPDCGALNVVPKPPHEATARHAPAALQGEQYEVWGVDEAPSVAEMIAAQPKYIAVLCHTCQTLMHATPEQVGYKLKCPDCGALTIVEPPHEPVQHPVATSDEYELEIDPELDPGERPHVIVPPRRPMLYEEEAEAARHKAEEREAQGKHRGPKYDVQGRAVMPRYPLLTRIIPFMFTRGIAARWLSLTLSWFVIVSPMWLASQTKYGMIVALPFGIFTVFALAIWVAAVAAIAMAVIVESSEGNDEVEQWPSTNPIDWVGEFFYLVFAGLVSPLPGWLLGRFVSEPATQVMLFVGSVLICFPVAILSQLDVGSAFAVASPRVIGSFFRVPGSWLVFYGEIALVWLTCLGLTFAADAVGSGYLLALLLPVYIGAVLLSARILGRLAWKLAESTPGRDNGDDEPAAA